MTNKKVAIVHEWLSTYAGSERVTEAIVKLYSTAKIYCLVDFLNKEDRLRILNNRPTITSFIQKLPFAKNNFRLYFPFLYPAIRLLNIKKSDVIISSSHAFAHSVKTRKHQLHICYCHTPMRYIWDMQGLYLEANNMHRGILSLVPRMFASFLRRQDYKTAQKVNYFISNSAFTANRIKNCYNRSAKVIYPPVKVNYFQLESKKSDYYLTASRLVCYKKTEVIVKAFANMPDKKLIVIGDGIYKKELKALASPNIKFLPFQDFEKLHDYMQKAKAFVFAGEEDFGITMVEAQACGTPVVAFEKGGASEIVIPDKTGVLFKEQTPESLQAAIYKFEGLEKDLDYKSIRVNSERFSEERYDKEFSGFVQECIEKKFGEE